MKKYILLFGMLGIVLFFTRCDLGINDEKLYVSGKGELVSIKLSNVDTFNLMTHAAIGNVNLLTGDSLEVEIIAQQNIIDLMYFEFENKHFKWAFNQNVVISEVDTIILNVTMPNPIVGIQMIGSGNFVISGVKQGSLYLNLIGVGYFDCYGLEVDICDIDHQGVGDFRIFANKEIIGELSGVGKIYYKGDPEIDINIIGNGVIIDDN
jgi:hypothetical protein